MKLKLAISSCPNDTFMFDHFLKHTNFEIDLLIEDIESLNKLARLGETDITKLSYHTYAKLTESYNLLNAGGALGENCGPILVSKHKAYSDEISDMKIAIPGEMTTANLLLDIFYPKVKNKQVYVFSDIEDAVLDGECDAGLIIHESRFTYEKKGLNKIIDIGELWESRYHLPTPLGGIAIHKRVPKTIATQIDTELRESIIHAFEHPDDAMPFIRKHAQEMEDSVMKKHIALYVNHYSIGDDPTVKQAINKLIELHNQSVSI
jgi:1,4-dihydroxy-6-naphthoate synthase